MTGRSQGSRGTRKTGTYSRAGSKKSKNPEDDIADMEIEEIEAIIYEKEQQMGKIRFEMNKIRKNKLLNAGGKEQKLFLYANNILILGTTFISRGNSDIFRWDMSSLN